MLFKKKSISKNFLNLIWAVFSISSWLSLYLFRHHNIWLDYTSGDASNDLSLLGAKLAGVWLYWFGGASYVITSCMVLYFVPKLLNFNWQLSLDRLIGAICLSVATLFLCQKVHIGNYGNLPGGGLLGTWLLTKIVLPNIILYVLVTSLIWIGLILYSRLCFIGLVQYLISAVQIICQPLWKKINIKFNKQLEINEPLSNIDDNVHQSVLEHEYAQLLAELDTKVHQDIFWHNYLQPKKNNSNNIINQTEIIDLSEPIFIKNKEDNLQIVLPTIEVCAKPNITEQKNAQEVLEQQSDVLINKLKRFGILGKVTAIKPGPVITLFEFTPAEDAKISKIVALESDLALALETASLRIIAPVPGKPVVGFEVANKVRQSVMLSDVLQDLRFTKFVESIKNGQTEKLEFQIPIAIGKDTVGQNVLIDLVKTPHLLVAGSTGSGKSVALNSILVSMLCANPPERVRLILIDPKRLEFARYADIGHLLFPIISDSKRVLLILRWVVKEMERRYEQMALAGVRNMADYNIFIKNDQNNSDKKLLPYIVIVIDELADLMMTSGKDVEDLIIRIAQMARAAGIHMIVATQRPSVDVVTGLIKVNFPSRISFRVASKADSRTILDSNGADTLLGSGDMLMLDAQSAALKRAHGAYVTDSEVNNVVQFILNNYQTNYLNLDEMQFACASENLQEEDALLGDVLDFLKQCDEVSISLLQRRFRIGYNRSARIMDMLESYGYVLTLDNGKMRKVIKDRLE